MRWAAALVVSCLAACGGRSELTEDLPPPRSLRSTLCGRARFVSRGPTAVGDWLFDLPTRRFVPVDACLPYHSGTLRTLVVPSYWLMEDAVSQECYEACVADGRCAPFVPDPEDPNRETGSAVGATLPAYTTHADAERFCDWLGGARLPSAAELFRAAQGASPGAPGVAAITAAIIDCEWSRDAGIGELCERLASLDRGVPVGNVARDALPAEDVGPFGHRGLAMAAPQMSRSFWTSDDLCGVKDGSIDFVTFPSPSGSHVHALVDLFRYVKAPVGSFRRTTKFGVAPFEDDRRSFRQGFRCAWDAASPP